MIPVFRKHTFLCLREKGGAYQLNKYINMIISYSDWYYEKMTGDMVKEHPHEDRPVLKKGLSEITLS